MVSKQPTKPHTASPRSPKRDFELCKVVLGAAISQILYARRAFPPTCFQVLPLEQVVFRSFENIVTTGSRIQLHEKELLRAHSTTVFLRQGGDYGISRFLGILAEDIFPLIESEGLAKFRISYLRAKAWGGDCLVEYYTITFKYELDGRYGMDIWRAGMGRHHISTGDSQLWNLGDYLSRLPSWTDDMHWTLAFHATERPDDPPIGLWKFDRTNFDDANLALQQNDEYTYARVARLEIMPSPLKAHNENVAEPMLDPGPWSDPEPDFTIYQQSQRNVLSTEISSQAQTNRKGTQKPAIKTRAKDSRAWVRGAAATKPSTRKLSPRGNISKQAVAVIECKADARTANTDKGALQNGKDIRKAVPTKGRVPKRKAKQPVQIFEDVASSLPATQVLGESQSLSQRTQPTKRPGDHGPNGAWIPHKRFRSDIPRSPSLDGFRLLDGISLSPEAISETDESSPHHTLPTRAHTNNHHGGLREASTDGFGSPFKLGMNSSVSLGFRPSQWKPQASPPENLLGITISEDEEETASEAEDETLPRHPGVSETEADFPYSFSPNTVARRTSLFYDIPSDSDEE